MPISWSFRETFFGPPEMLVYRKTRAKLPRGMMGRIQTFTWPVWEKKERWRRFNFIYTNIYILKDKMQSNWLIVREIFWTLYRCRGGVNKTIWTKCWCAAPLNHKLTHGILTWSTNPARSIISTENLCSTRWTRNGEPKSKERESTNEMGAKNITRKCLQRKHIVLTINVCLPITAKGSWWMARTRGFRSISANWGLYFRTSVETRRGEAIIVHTATCILSWSGLRPKSPTRALVGEKDSTQVNFYLSLLCLGSTT